MDKSQNFRLNLVKIMFGARPQLDAIITEHLQKAQAYLKPDGSPVTDLDLALSAKLEQLAQELHLHFYSEENIGQWKFPLMMVDPLDGTKEFIAGRDEWVVSVALLKNARLEGAGWIYNPLQQKVYQEVSPRSFVEKGVYYGEASRSEWAKGYYQENFANFQMKPMGSIAFKLARLAAGEVDFIVSLHPKNIWDIAAGTLLCQDAGISFYAAGKKVTEFVPYFEGPLIWCFDELYPQLSRHFY